MGFNKIGINVSDTTHQRNNQVAFTKKKNEKTRRSLRAVSFLPE